MYSMRLDIDCTVCSFQPWFNLERMLAHECVDQIALLMTHRSYGDNYISLQSGAGLHVLQLSRYIAAVCKSSEVIGIL